MWSVNKIARAITRWTKPCDKRLARLISYIRHASECRQYCHVVKTATQCRLGLFQDSDFAGDLEDSKSTSDGLSCTFGSERFVSISWMCKKQSSVSHKSTEAETVSLDEGLRMDGIPAFDLWDCVIEVFHSYQTKPTQREILYSYRETCCKEQHSTCENNFRPSTSISIRPMLITFHQRETFLFECSVICL